MNTTTTTTDSCPATVRSSRLAQAQQPTPCRLSDAEIALLVGEIVTLESAAQRRTEARPS